MKNILLGVLLVALAAVVVNKKTWKHRTFLLIVVGILVVMMAVSMIFVGKEMFQSASTTASPTVALTGCNSTDVTYYIRRDSNFDGNETVTWNTLMTNGITNFNASIAAPATATSTTDSYDDIALRRWCYMLNSLYNAGCYDRMLSFFDWAMGNHTLIFPPGTVAATYTGPALNANSNGRYMNFVELAKQYRTDLFDANGNVQTPKASYYIAGPNPNQTNYRLMMFYPYKLMALYTQLCAKKGMTGDMIKYTGMWLDRVANYSYAVHGSGFNVGIHFFNSRISRILGAVIGGSMVCSSSVKTTSGIGACSEFLKYFTENTPNASNINRVPGFIYDAIVPDQFVIERHSILLSVIFYGLFVIKNTYQLKDRDYTGVTPAIKISARMAQIAPIVFSIVQNLNSDEQIEADAKNLTPTQLDTLMRNYLGDARCVQPLTLAGIRAVISGTTYSKDVLSAGGSTIPSLGATMGDISNMLRAAIYKSNLDTNNQTWLGGWDGKSTGAGATDQKPMPSIADIASIKPTRRNNFGMYDYIFGTGALPADYFNGSYINNIWNGYTPNGLFDGNLSDFEVGLKLLSGAGGQTTTNCVSLVSAPTTASTAVSTPAPVFAPVVAPLVQAFTPALHYDPSNPGSYPGYGTVLSNIGAAGTMNGTMTSGISVSSGLIDLNRSANDKLAISFASPYNFGNVMTLSAWVFPRINVGNMNILLSSNRTGTGSSGFSVGWNSYTPTNTANGVLFFEYSNGTAWTGVSSPNNTIEFNKWQHLAYQFDLTQSPPIVRLYKNGVQVGSGNVSTGFSINGPFAIGNSTVGGTLTTDGLLGSMKVFGAALTAQQVKDEYNAGRTKYGLPAV